MNKISGPLLILDDDYESMFPLKRYLEQRYGYTVVLSAEQNVVAQLQQVEFALLCVDIMIHPLSLNAENQEVQNIQFEGVNWKKTGLEFVKRLRSGQFTPDPKRGTQSQVPIIVLSAVANGSNTNADIANLANVTYMEKPYILQELIDCLQVRLEESQP